MLMAFGSDTLAVSGVSADESPTRISRFVASALVTAGACPAQTPEYAPPELEPVSERYAWSVSFSISILFTGAKADFRRPRAGKRSR
jgi:hypothetical protein